MSEIVEEGDPVIEDIDIEDENLVHDEIEEIDEDEFEEWKLFVKDAEIRLKQMIQSLKYIFVEDIKVSARTTTKKTQTKDSLSSMQTSQLLRPL